MSRRRNRTLTKAQRPGNSPAVQGTMWTPDQVAAVLRATVASAGGQAAMPLPRLESMPPFGPGIPLVPAPINVLRPDSGRAEPRAYEYPVAWNLPGFGERLVPWKVLRDAADMIPLIRRCIEIRKAEVATLDWDVVISAKAVERAQRQDPGSARSDIEKAMRERVDPHIGRLVDFWEQPDPRNGHDFIAWAGKLLEEYFVLDALAIYPRMRRNGDLYGFEILDGTTIKPLLDADGFRPLTPQPAYQQILHGFPRGEFTADGQPDPDTGALPGAYPSDRLVYKVHNVRSWTPYGFSAVEQALTDGELYLRRLGWLKSEYTDGVMPAGWLKAGAGQADWSPQQLAEYERQFNDFYAGNTIARQRFRILPWGMEPDDSRTDLGERYKPEYDLHLIKLVSSHLDTTIAELGFTETGGLGSTGWHEGQADVQDRKATQPTLRRLQSLCTHLMRTFLGAPPELEFRVLGLEAEDEDSADEVASRRIAGARMTLNEDRDRTGLPRYTFPEADMPMLVTGRGVVFLEGASEIAPPGTLIGPAAPAASPGAPAFDDQGNPIEPAAGIPPVVPGQTPPAGEPAPGKPGPAKPDAAAVKAELVAYRRWLAKGKTSRPFRFETITKADAAAAGVDLAHAEFLTKAGGDPGTAPKVRHWPGWERDLTVAEHWAPKVRQALTGAVSAKRLAGNFLALHAAAGVGSARSWLTTQHLPIAERLRPILAGLWTDGYVVGAISSRTVLTHHGLVVKSEAAYQPVEGGSMAAWTEPEPYMLHQTDWGSWTPGHEAAAREVLGAEGMGDGLAALLEHGGVVLQGIEDTKLDQLAEILGRGLAAGDAPVTIATAIWTLVDNPKWAYTVAVTETTRAVSSATLLRYSRNGVDAKDWMTADDQHVCSPCAINEDTGAIPLDSNFPDGNDAPPGHPLCRCSLGPAWLTAEEAAAEGVGPLVGLPDFGVAEDLATRTAGEILTGTEPELEPAVEVLEETPVTATEQATYEDRLAQAVKNGDVAEAAGGRLDMSGLHMSEDPGWSETETEKLTKELRDYQGANYIDVNNWLRGSSQDFYSTEQLAAMRETVEARIARLDKIFSSSPLADDAQVFRGLRTGRGIFGDQLSEDLTGFTWSEGGYGSTSAEEEHALAFAGGAGKDTPGVLMRILAPRGVGAVFVGDPADELLLQRGLSFRVVADRGVQTVESGWNRGMSVRILDVEAEPLVARAAGEILAEGAPDGLDEMAEHSLRNLATEYEVPRAGQLSRDELIAQMRELGVISPAKRQELNRIEAEALERRQAELAAQQHAANIVRYQPDLTGLENLADQVRDGFPGASRETFKGGEVGVVEKITMPDGTRYFGKVSGGWLERPPEGITDSEQLASLLGRALDAPVPGVVRDAEDRIFTDWAEGKPGQEWFANPLLASLDGEPDTDFLREVVADDPSRRLGLLDILIQNQDRHTANWLLDADGTLTGIDHGNSWWFSGPDVMALDDEAFMQTAREGLIGPFVRDQFINQEEFEDTGTVRLQDSTLMTPADVAEARARLEALRPDFIRLGHEDWLDYSLRVLDLIGPYAKGTRSIFR